MTRKLDGHTTPSVTLRPRAGGGWEAIFEQDGITLDPVRFWTRRGAERSVRRTLAKCVRYMQRCETETVVIDGEELSPRTKAAVAREEET